MLSSVHQFSMTGEHPEHPNVPLGGGGGQPWGCINWGLILKEPVLQKSYAMLAVTE